MSEVAPPAGWKHYLRFLALATGILAILLLLGYLPTRRLGGEAALPAMWAGCLVGLLGSLAGSVPVVLARKLPVTQAIPVVTGSFGLRLLVVLVLGVLLVWLAGFAPTPLLLWVATSHAALLVADARFALGVLKQAGRGQAQVKTSTGKTSTGKTLADLEEP